MSANYRISLVIFFALIIFAVSVVPSCGFLAKFYLQVPWRHECLQKRVPGFCFHRCMGTPQDTWIWKSPEDVAFEESISQLKIEAENGNALSAYKLSQYYFEDILTPRDGREHLKWLLIAAKGGSSSALLSLAMLYDPLYKTEIETIVRNETDATKWYLESAQRGNKKAQIRLGSRFKKSGFYVDAAFWYSVAGYEAGRKAALETLTSEEKITLEQRLSEWKPLGENQPLQENK